MECMSNVLVFFCRRHLLIGSVLFTTPGRMPSTTATTTTIPTATTTTTLPPLPLPLLQQKTLRMTIRQTQTALLGLLLLGLLIIIEPGTGVVAYQPIPTGMTRRRQLRLLQQTIKPENEWGIPYSSDLPPLEATITTKNNNNNNNQLTRNSKRLSCLSNGGRVTLLGSGPGDPELLTVAAYKLLTNNNNNNNNNQNTVVIADRLVSSQILDLIPKETQVLVARKLPGCAELAQEEIYWWAYQALNQGKHVIRLKIGDPFVFGRGGEEVLTFRRFGVEATVIPVGFFCSVLFFCLNILDGNEL
jgi:hypothetical protein